MRCFLVILMTLISEVFERLHAIQYIITKVARVLCANARTLAHYGDAKSRARRADAGGWGVNNNRKLERASVARPARGHPRRDKDNAGGWGVNNNHNNVNNDINKNLFFSNLHSAWENTEIKPWIGMICKWTDFERVEILFFFSIQNILK